MQRRRDQTIHVSLTQKTILLILGALASLREMMSRRDAKNAERRLSLSPTTTKEFQMILSVEAPLREMCHSET